MIQKTHLQYWIPVSLKMCWLCKITIWCYTSTNTLTISLFLLPAAALPQSGWIGRPVHQWADSGRCPHGSWWCTLHYTGCCRSCCRPPEPLCLCASPLQSWSAWATHPSAKTFKFSVTSGECIKNTQQLVSLRRSGLPSPFSQHCTRQGQRTEESAVGLQLFLRLSGTVGGRHIHQHKQIFSDKCEK